MSVKDDFVRKMHLKLDEWNADIDALSARADQFGAEARAEYHEQMDALRSKRDEAQERLNALQQSGESAWEDAKTGIELAWTAISEALDSAKSRFK